MTLFHINSLLRRIALALLLALPLASGAAPQLNFATPEAAVAAFAAALNAKDEAALLAIFGDKHPELLSTGDAAYDAALRAETSARLATFRALVDSGKERRILLIGAQAWPFAIPLLSTSGGWRFATEEGIVEVQNRRIGANERAAIQVLRAYPGAQREYASRDRDGDGVLQFAQLLLSTAGKFNGLYWPSDAAKGEEPSPFGPLVGESSAYLAGHKRSDPYRGYHFRVLTGQGKNAAGGPYRYIINGRMLAGFGLVAYPDAYDESGVMTLIVNQNGKVYQKDLGPRGASIAAKMVDFDPGPGWTEVTP